MIAIPGYRIERLLGEGGMAIVYLALQESLARPVALKLLKPALAADPERVERFIHEGRLAARLHHRHIMAIHDVGVHQGQPYMALEYVAGGALSALPMPLADAMRMLGQIAQALAIAHAGGVLHRDLKPANILVRADGDFVLGDFGIALAEGTQVQTGQGLILGTPAYLAPERWRGEAADAQSDLYSLGVLLYEVLVGRLPYSAEDLHAVGLQHLHTPVPRLPAPLQGAQPILDALMAKSKEHRCTDAATLIRALEVGHAEPVSVLPVTDRPWHRTPAQAVSLFEPQPSTVQRMARRLWLPAAALVVAVLIWMFPGYGRNPLSLPPDAGALATIAVVPCELRVSLPAHPDIGDILAEELIYRLSALRALTVIARSTTFALRGSDLGPRELGALTGASHALGCVIRRAPDGVRVLAELVDTRTGALVWHAEYARDPAELLALVDTLAVDIAERLLERLAGPERARLIRHRTHSIDAIRLVEQAQKAADAQTPEAFDEARSMARQALALDPEYAQATLTLAHLAAEELALTYPPPPDWRAGIEPLIESALALDPELAAALVLRSRIACRDRDWALCGSAISDALRLAPGNAQVQAQATEWARLAGEPSRALLHARRRLAIEPGSAAAWSALVLATMAAGQPEQALLWARQARERQPSAWSPRLAQAQVLARLGRCREGLDALVAATERGAPVALAGPLSAHLYACADELTRVEALLRSMDVEAAVGGSVDEMTRAVVLLALGRNSQALDALESLEQNGDPRMTHWLATGGLGIESLVGDARLASLLVRSGLPAAAIAWSRPR